jgi:hypothetical protein
MIKKRKPTNEWKPVESSTIHSYHYGNISQQLRVRFKDKTGAITSLYIFDKVGRYISNDLAETDSVGKYFHANIKDKFETRKVY